ncbi:hypothetical protein [Methylobacterium sp. GXS13]|uniref:hypothetical protein n=1 Tax=Methylobacterium sp. GXS13 TaxID=1730094 RepID=UPI00128E9DA2|nr:hypothetical protein [Methylobacterium sp. GXS13]
MDADSRAARQLASRSKLSAPIATQEQMASRAFLTSSLPQTEPDALQPPVSIGCRLVEDCMTLLRLVRTSSMFTPCFAIDREINTRSIMAVEVFGFYPRDIDVGLSLSRWVQHHDQQRHFSCASDTDNGETIIVLHYLALL